MENLAMGEYGIYVWSSFGLTFAVLAVCIVQTRRLHANVVADIRTRIKAMESD
ncbi:MAG: heme exporter protein CcmD [Gammaproteobacteria bacterium]